MDLKLQPPFVIIMDTIHMVDENSWNLIELLCTGEDNCKRLTIVMIMQTDNKDEVRVAESAQKAFKEVWVSEAFKGL
jgi:hypothetical protein